MTRPRLPDSLRRLPVAHRAYHDRAAGRVENSRAAIRAAIYAGYAIEIDLQLSSDGHAMVFHDDDLDRLTGATGPVRARSATELQGIRLKDADEGIPTFAEVLALVAGRVPLLVELKDQDGGFGPGVGVLEATAARLLAGYAGDVAVMSFNPHSVAEMARLLPRIPRGITSWEWKGDEADDLTTAHRDTLRAIADYDRVGASFVSHHWTDLARPRVAELAAQGADVLCWTIRSAADEAEARKLACNVTFEGYAAAIPQA